MSLSIDRVQKAVNAGLAQTRKLAGGHIAGLNGGSHSIAALWDTTISAAVLYAILNGDPLLVNMKFNLNQVGKGWALSPGIAGCDMCATARYSPWKIVKHILVAIIAFAVAQDLIVRVLWGPQVSGGMANGLSKQRKPNQQKTKDRKQANKLQSPLIITAGMRARANA